MVVMMMTAAAHAVLIIMMMVLVLLILVVMVMTLMLVLIIVVMVVVMMMVAAFVVIIVVVMVMMVAAFVVVIVVVMLGQHRRQHICREVVIVLHRREDGFAADLIPRVVMMRALALCSRSSATTASSFSWLMPCVRLSRMVPAYSIWLRKNSPKFLTYMRHFPASATVTKLPISASGISFSTPSTARMTSESLPTPLGSMRMRSG